MILPWHSIKINMDMTTIKQKQHITNQTKKINRNETRFTGKWQIWRKPNIQDEITIKLKSPWGKLPAKAEKTHGSLRRQRERGERGSEGGRERGDRTRIIDYLHRNIYTCMYVCIFINIYILVNISGSVEKSCRALTLASNDEHNTTEQSQVGLGYTYS